MINTGTQRSVVGHAISGATASLIVSSAMNIAKVKEQKLSPQMAIQNSLKMASAGAIATGYAIVTANYLNQDGGFLKAISALSLGIASLYALEIMFEKIHFKGEENA